MPATVSLAGLQACKAMDRTWELCPVTTASLGSNKKGHLQSLEAEEVFQGLRDKHAVGTRVHSVDPGIIGIIVKGMASP